MPDIDGLHKDHHESEDESEEEEVEEIPQVDIDVTQLTPLSPEVISKQVRHVGLNSLYMDR
jgi:translation initiation factor 2 subunit 3